MVRLHKRILVKNQAKYNQGKGGQKQGVAGHAVFFDGDVFLLSRRVGLQICFAQ